MRATLERGCWFAQGDDAANAPGNEVEFGHSGGVPQGYEAALSVARRDRSVGKRSGNAFEGGEIEAVDDATVGSVQEEGFVGTVAGDEELLDAAVGGDTESRRIGDILELIAADFPGRNSIAWGQREKSLGGHFAILKGVDGNAVSGASLPFSEGIGEGSHGGVEMLAVKTEREAQEISLLGPVAQAVVGKIAEFVGFQIQNRDGLFLAGGVGTEAAVEENSKAAIWRNNRGSGEIIDTARITGEFAKDFGIGDLRCLRVRCGVLRQERNCGGD